MARSQESSKGIRSALIVSATLLSSNALAFFGHDTGLLLSASTGEAPLHVKITGPADVIPPVNSRPQPWFGCGVSIDWGDSQGEPPTSCAAMLEHTYYKTGNFTITMKGFHPGPDDSPRTDWLKEASVRVEAPKNATAKVYFVKDPVGQTQWEDQNVSARYAVMFSGSADLLLELLDASGKVVSTEKRPLKEPGEGWPMPHDSYLYENNQKTPVDVKLRITLLQGGVKVAEATSGVFKMTAQYKTPAK